MAELILYMGGCCGDIITGLIDTKGISIESGKCVILEQRERLKRSFSFENDTQKDEYIKDASVYWKSLPSHDAEYHIQNNHKYLGVVCSDRNTALWAATRFRGFYSDTVWNRMSEVSGAKTIEDYAQSIMDFSYWIKTKASSTIELLDIVHGNAIDKLKLLTELDSSANIMYTQWLKAINDK